MSIISKLFRKRHIEKCDAQLTFNTSLSVNERVHALKTIHAIRALHTLLAGGANRMTWIVSDVILGIKNEAFSNIIDSEAGVLFADYMVVGVAYIHTNSFARLSFDEARNRTDVIEIINNNCPLESAASLLFKLKELERAQAQAYYLAGSHVFAVPVNTTLVATPQEVAEARELLQKSIRNAGVGGIEILPTQIEFKEISNRLADFKFNELSVQLTRELCNLYGIDSSLLNDPDNKTYSNKTEAMRAFYTNVIIPYASQFLSTLHHALYLNNIFNFIVSFDASMLEPLAEQRQKNVDTLLKLYEKGIISLDEIRQSLEL